MTWWWWYYSTILNDQCVADKSLHTLCKWLTQNTRIVIVRNNDWLLSTRVSQVRHDNVTLIDSQYNFLQFKPPTSFLLRIIANWLRQWLLSDKPQLKWLLEFYNNANHIQVANQDAISIDLNYRSGHRSLMWYEFFTFRSLSYKS